MRSLISSGAPAIILSMGVASAASVGGCTSLDYAQNQQRLQMSPSDSVGTGEAHIGDGSSPGYYAPVFSGGRRHARQAA
jgi:hypothetical protein